MAYFYNFNFDENVLYGMPIYQMFAPSKNRRMIAIKKEDDTVPRTSNPYICDKLYQRVREFPACVYKRCFWLEERDDKLAEEIRQRYLEERAKKKADKCHYCMGIDGDCAEDIFFDFIDLFGTGDNQLNPDITTYIDDEGCINTVFMHGEHAVKKFKKPINYCPFCGRRLRQ